MTSAGSVKEVGLKFWESMWTRNAIDFHDPEVNSYLVKHLDKLIPSETEVKKVYIPLCGKSLDIKWLADKGITVVGVEYMQMAVEEFFRENNLSYTEESSKDGFKVLRSDNNKIRVYCGNALNFTKDIEGTFDAIWDRAAFVALNPADQAKHACCLKQLLNPGGRILTELMEYDMEAMKVFPQELNPPPPAYSITEDELRSWFGDGYTIQILDRWHWPFEGIDRVCPIYLITKNLE